MTRPRRRLGAHLRYLFALLKRFRLTAVLVAVLFGLIPLLYVFLYEGPAGERVRFGHALHHVYFLLMGEPTLPYVDNLLLEFVTMLIPPVGIAVVLDGVVRFAYLYFAKHRSDKEWIEVISQTLKDHVVVCGAGRVGYRVASQLLDLGRELVVIEKNEKAPFVTVLRDLGVPVLIEDVRTARNLERVNVASAAALVCATDDDLANLNIALDARRANPDIRVVIRLFDDDLVARVRETFQAEAFSTSNLAAPALALAALDPRIVHSFTVGKHLMVVSPFEGKGGLVGMTLTQVRDQFGGVTLSIRRRGGVDEVHPQGATKVAEGDLLTVQSLYDDYLKLRQFTGEAVPPLYGKEVA
ncbi:MAG: potassium channel family protein [Myxococcota bacterium]